MSAALDSMSTELRRRSEEKDEIIEVLQSQHSHLSQMLRQQETDGSTVEVAPQQQQPIVAEIRHISTETELCKF